MAKCSVCNAKKGKRACLLHSGHVCSLCCGQTRVEKNCEECIHYRPPSIVKRKYNDIPSYSVSEMEHSFYLQEYSNLIESTICNFDLFNDKQLKDETVIRIIELLLDKYYFNDEMINTNDELITSGFKQIVTIINKDTKIDTKVLIKVISLLHFISRRRSKGKREYLDCIHQYVGVALGNGSRLMPISKELYER